MILLISMSSSENSKVTKGTSYVLLPPYLKKSLAQNHSHATFSRVVKMLNYAYSIVPLPNRFIPISRVPKEKENCPTTRVERYNTKQSGTHAASKNPALTICAVY
jgi:hypothetical protein